MDIMETSKEIQINRKIPCLLYYSQCMHMRLVVLYIYKIIIVQNEHLPRPANIVISNDSIRAYGLCHGGTDGSRPAEDSPVES